MIFFANNIGKVRQFIFFALDDFVDRYVGHHGYYISNMGIINGNPVEF
jgi:hypothetical protein